MKNLKFLMGILIMFGTLTGAFVVSSATTSDPMTVNAKGTLSSGLQYQATGSISSINDISNGNLKANLLVDSSITPPTVKAQLLDGAIQIGTNSQFIVKSGTPILDEPKSKKFEVNSTDSILPSVLITQVGKTQTGESLDVLVSLQNVTGTTPGNSFFLFDGNQSDGSLGMGETDLAGVKASYQFQDSTTHQPVKLFMFPVIGDIDATQQFSMNGTNIGYGSNLTEDRSGLFTSTDTGVNGFADYPLGGLLYEFYGDTIVSQFNTKADGSADPGSPGYGIFGSYGSVKNISLIYPNSSTTVNYLNSFTKQAIQSPQVNTGMVYSPFTFLAPTISGYQLNSTLSDTSKLSGIYASTNTAINLYYDKQSTVTVNYLDSQTKQSIQKTQVLNGLQGNNYQVIPQTVSGYRFNNKLSASTSGVYQATNSTVNFYYDKASTVTFNLTNGVNVLQSITINGYSGDSYSYDLPPLQNYVTPNPTKLTGNFTNNNQVIPVLYPKATGTLTLNYLDVQSGKAVQAQKKITSNLGGWQTIHIPNILGYDYHNTGVEVAFQQLLPNEERTLYYEPNVDTIKVDYEDPSGHLIAESQTFTGYYNSNRLLKAVPVKGYQAITSNATVVFNQLYQHLVFKYQPEQESVHLHFVDDAGHKVYADKIITGTYGSTYNYRPSVSWYDHLTYTSQDTISGKYQQPKTDITVRYTRRQAALTFVYEDDFGTVLKTKTIHGFENEHYSVSSPKYWWLNFYYSDQKVEKGIFQYPNQTIHVWYQSIPAQDNIQIRENGQTVESYTYWGYLNHSYTFPVSQWRIWYLNPDPGPSSVHIHFTKRNNTKIIEYNQVKSTITLNYVDDWGNHIDGEALTWMSGDEWTYNVPSELGDYYLKDYQTWNLTFQKYNQNINIHYEYLPYTTITLTYEGTDGAYLGNFQVNWRKGDIYNYYVPDTRYGYSLVGGDYYHLVFGYSNQNIIVWYRPPVKTKPVSHPSASGTRKSNSPKESAAPHPKGTAHANSSKSPSQNSSNNKVSRSADKVKEKYENPLLKKIKSFVKDKIIDKLEEVVSNKMASKIYNKFVQLTGFTKTQDELGDGIANIFSFFNYYHEDHNATESFELTAANSAIDALANKIGGNLAIRFGMVGGTIGFEMGGPALALTLAGIGAVIGYYLAWAIGQLIENYVDKGIRWMFGDDNDD